MITRVRLFPNHNQKSLDMNDLIQSKLEANGFAVVEKDYDLAIAIGGDGSFLRMVKQNSFNSELYYIGINTGTLGFLQEIKPEEVDRFIEKLKSNLYKIEEVSIQETTIETDTEEEKFYSLNEIVIRDSNLNTLKMNIKIDNELLERYVGDGLLIATSIGSTAYNLSFGGSIIYNSLHTLQITPIAPLNTKSYRDILNSVVIPETSVITLTPISKDIIITVDGENLNYCDVKEITTSVCNKKIHCLRMNDYDYTNIINDKFLS